MDCGRIVLVADRRHRSSLFCPTWRREAHPGTDNGFPLAFTLSRAENERSVEVDKDYNIHQKAVKCPTLDCRSSSEDDHCQQQADKGDAPKHGRGARGPDLGGGPDTKVGLGSGPDALA